MADNKKSFLLYCDLIHTVKKLPKEKAGELFVHILEYVNDNNPKSEDILIDIAFEPIKQQLKRDLVKYEQIAERNRENGKKGGRGREPKEPSGFSGNQSQAKIADNDNDTDNDTVSDNETVIEKFCFKNSLIKYGFEKNLVEDWLKVRKNKKATNSETAYASFISEIGKRQCDLNETLKIIITKSWAGFKWDWIDNVEKQKNGTNKRQVAENTAGPGRA
jgi:hypothetical protein